MSVATPTEGPRCERSPDVGQESVTQANDATTASHTGSHATANGVSTSLRAAPRMPAREPSGPRGCGGSEACAGPLRMRSGGSMVCKSPLGTTRQPWWWTFWWHPQHSSIKGVSPMPGGYDGYLESLRWTAETIQSVQLTEKEMAARMAVRFNLRESAASSRLSFLRKVDFLRLDSATFVIPELTYSWLQDGDPSPLLAGLHFRVHFIGEMLAALDDPMTTAELRRWACEQYLQDWKTNTQIDNRRGWLQSAGLMGCRDRRMLYRVLGDVLFGS